MDRLEEALRHVHLGVVVEAAAAQAVEHEVAAGGLVARHAEVDEGGEQLPRIVEMRDAHRVRLDHRGVDGELGVQHDVGGAVGVALGLAGAAAGAGQAGQRLADPARQLRVLLLDPPPPEGLDLVEIGLRAVVGEERPPDRRKGRVVDHLVRRDVEQAIVLGRLVPDQLGEARIGVGQLLVQRRLEGLLAVQIRKWLVDDAARILPGEDAQICV